MNAYQLSAESYKRLVKKGHPTGAALEDMQRKIEALEIMANTDRPTQYEIFNSSGFNDIVKGYVLMALDNTETDNEQRKAVLSELRCLFDTVSAKQAERYYMEH